MQISADEVSTTIKYMMQIDLKRVINDSKNYDNLSVFMKQRQSQGQTQETAKNITSVSVVTPDQNSKEILIDSTASATRLTKLGINKVHIKFKFFNENI